MKRPYNIGRRSSERANCALKTHYHLSDGKDETSHTLNIGEGGILLMVTGDINVDDTIDLEIEMGPQEQSVKTRGRIVHTRNEKNSQGTERLAGVAFLNLSDKHREAIGRKVWRQILEEATRITKTV
jgi:c-di-GMP-binding flagellar brake protein YcgR